MSAQSTLSDERFSWSLLLLAIVLVGSVETGCWDAGAQRLTDAQEAALTDTIRAQAEEIVQHHGQLRADAFLQQYSDDVQSYILGEPYIGPKFRTWYRKTVGAFESVSVQVTDMQVTILSPKSAVATYRYEEQVRDTTSREYPVAGVQTLAFKRRDGMWKVVQFQAQHVSVGGS
jgi:ketosteroid isomerase-like protein